MVPGAALWFNARYLMIRIVRMTFDPAKAEAFLYLFDAVAPQIRAFPGCQHLELWQDQRFANVLTTYSQWDGRAALDAYRQSDLFQETWAKTKPLFAAAPVAFSQELVRHIKPKR